jgi:hypothetical protein
MNSAFLAAFCSAVAGLLLLAGCVSSGSGNAALLNKYSTSCMFEVNPPGSYVFSDSDTEVKPGGGGTAEGAAALNDCIKRKAAAAGETLETAKASQPRQVVEVEQSGTQVVETFTYGQPPATPPRKTAAREENCRQRSVFSGGTGYNDCVR